MLDFLTNLFANLALAQILPAVIIAVVGVVGINLAVKLIEKALDKSKLEKAAHKLVLSVVKVGLFLLLALMVASKLVIDVTGVVALASVVTLAISLALQNALANVFGGFVLLSTHPFKTGDFVELSGQSGTVIEIGMTYTKLNTPDNKQVSIPNSAVTASQIVNYTTTGTRRVDITVSASYDSAIEDVLGALINAANVPTALMGKAPFAAVKGYGESAIEYVLHVWTDADHYWDTLFAVNQNIQAQFKNAGVKMTYPHVNVHMDK